MKQSYQTRGPSTAVTLLVAVSTAILSMAAHGQVTLDPGTQPPLMLAPYVLESTNLEANQLDPDDQGGTYAYRPWFENGAWTGDIIKYYITSAGVRTRDEANPPGRYPRNGPGWNDWVSLWSARYVFPDYVPYEFDVEGTENWECVETDVNYWKEPTTPGGGRKLITYSEGLTIPLHWHRITDAQRAAIDPGFAAIDEDKDDPYASDILNFVRGDRSNERCKLEGEYRWRFSLLGPIINSEPVYVPAGSPPGTNGVVLVGANDGMLHGFRATDGKELFGYTPSIVMDRLGALSVSPFRHSYFVDGSLRYRNTGTRQSPRHIVAGGLGAGGRGLFALDVTDPEDPEILFELAGADRNFNGGESDYRIGHIHGRPSIARFPDGTPNGKWYIVTGNGYGSKGFGTGQQRDQLGRAFLVLIPLDGGQPVFIAAGATSNNGLSAPALVDATNNGIVDYVYAGDLQGTLWRFDFKESNTSTPTHTTPLFNTAANQPITVEPDVARHPTFAGFMVYFGTGSLLSRADAGNTVTQSIYGIWDRENRLSVNSNQLVTQKLETLSYTWAVPQTGNVCGVEEGVTTHESTVRIIPEQKPLIWEGTNRHLGWRVDLPADTGERLLTRPQVRAERLQFITTNPADVLNPPDPADQTIPAIDRNSAGSWMLQLDLSTGGINPILPKALFDLNKDCTLDLSDAVRRTVMQDGKEKTIDLIPVGLNLGPFNVSAPSYARVRFDSSIGSIVDGVYINALNIPPLEVIAPPAVGPIDVTTDVPVGYPAVRLNYADDDAAFPDQAYPEPVKLDTGSPNRTEIESARGPIKRYLGSDGFGNRVAGHSSAYNKVHGVNYVDFIDLEPRAGTGALDVSEPVRSDDPNGLLRLDVGSEYRDANGNIKSMHPRQAKRELYRVTDVVDMDQKFIVVVTNADLSKGMQLQIGCRTWAVYDYQTMMMEYLGPQAGLAMGQDVSEFVDTINPGGRTLVFTLNEILNEAPNCGPRLDGPTLRITPTARVGDMDVLMATLPGCVNNTHHYESSLPKPGAATASAVDLYAIDPHVTANQSSKDKGDKASSFVGYRWRNGALTIQLLKVDEIDGVPVSAYRLQEEEYLPVRLPPAQEGRDFGFGGIYARAFKIDDDVVVPLDEPNGLLYESSLFWHYGDMTRFTTRGQGNPVSPSCYGAMSTTEFNRETATFNAPIYTALTEFFADNPDQADRYVKWLDDLASGDENRVREAIDGLQALFAELVGEWGAQKDLTVADYHRLRVYVPNNPNLDLISIDRGIGVELEGDGTPVEVSDVERDLLPSLGPNYQPGRRSWIDLTPEE